MSRRSLTIISALDDPVLFKPLFPGDSWSCWRVFLKALFGLPMGEGDAEISRQHTERAEPPETQFREAALICGRRGGKSRMLGLVAVYLSCFRDYSPFIAAGETPTLEVIAADRKQAKLLLRYIVGTMQEIPLLRGQIEEEFAESLQLKNGVVIEVVTASYVAVRGRTIIGCLCDELAFWRREDSSNPATEILQAIRPGLATIPNSLLLMASSPYARSGPLWLAFKNHFGCDGARVLVWKATSREMNPALPESVVTEAMEADPESARSEYLAEFRDDIASFVSREVVDAVTVAGRYELPALSGVHYSSFVDPSGGSSDSMTLGIAHVDKDGTAVLDCVRERRPPFSPSDVVSEFAATLKSYRANKVFGDRYSGEWVREPFASHGIQYAVAEKAKSEIYRDTLPLLNSRKVELLDNPRLVSQLCGLERRSSRAGRDTIDHGPKGHDDVANAACGALLHASVPPPRPARSCYIDWMSR